MSKRITIKLDGTRELGPTRKTVNGFTNAYLRGDFDGDDSAPMGLDRFMAANSGQQIVKMDTCTFETFTGIARGVSNGKDNPTQKADTSNKK